MIKLGNCITSYAYDSIGNLTSGLLPANATQLSTLVWDGENRLIQSQTGNSGTVVKYVYDALGRRVMKTSGGNSTYWVYDDWNPIARYGGAEHTSGTPPTVTLQQRLLWGLVLSGTLQGAGGVGGLLSVNDTLIPFYDGNGNIVRHYTYYAGYPAAFSGDAYSYDPFGNLVFQGMPTTTFKDLTGYGFSTKPMDGETGLYYYGYRYYNPVMGRWINRDPIGENGGENLYGFVDNDALRHLDILGLVFEVDSCCDDDAKKKIAEDLDKVEKDLKKNLEDKKDQASLEALANFNYLKYSLKPKITIKCVSGGNAYDPSSDTIEFNPWKQTGGTDADGSNKRDASIGLGHEIGHAIDDAGLDDGKPGIDRNPATDPTKYPNRTEEKAVGFENEIRNGRWPNDPGRQRPVY